MLAIFNVKPEGQRDFSKIYKVLVWMEPTIPSIRACFCSLYAWVNGTAPCHGRASSCVTHSVVQRQLKPVSSWVAQVLLWHRPQLCVSTPFPVCTLLRQLKVKLVEGAVCKREPLLAMVLFWCVKTWAVTRWVTQQLRGPSEWNRQRT